jgi:hypothetical protein
MSSKKEKPPTSKEDAAARCVRPPPEKYDPDKRSRWSITMTVAWIIRRDLDAVRNEWDDYRNGCADWVFESDATARARVAAVAMMNISTSRIVPFDPDLQKNLQKKLPKKLRKDFQKGSWRLREAGYSGWSTLRASERMRPQDAMDDLWQAAEGGKIKATALEYENVKAYVGNPIEIPAHHWPYLKRTDDPLTGKAMLSGPDGSVYREVLFPQSDVKGLWPKSPPSLSREHPESGPSPLALAQLIESQMWEGPVFPPCAYNDSHRAEANAPEHVEKSEPEQTGPAEPERLEKKAWLAWALKEYPKRQNEPQTSYIRRLHGLMEKADNVTAPWKYKTFRIRYYDAVKAERQAVQKERKSPRTV